MPASRRPYPPEFRREAVGLALESGKHRREIAEDLGISTETLRKWVRQAEIDAGEREGLTTAEREELCRLRRENRLLREERETLKSRGLLRQGDRPEPATVYRFVEREKADPVVTTLCRVLGVSTSGYSAWRQRGCSARAQADAALTDRILAIHRAAAAPTGRPWTHAELRLAHDMGCSRKRVARLMRRAGLADVHRHRRHRGTTGRDPSETPGTPTCIATSWDRG